MTVAAVVLAASPASALADADGTPGVRRIADIAWAGRRDAGRRVLVRSRRRRGRRRSRTPRSRSSTRSTRERGPGRPDRERHRGRGAGSSPRPTPRSCGRRAWPGWTPRPSRTLIETHGEDRDAVTPPGVPAATPGSPSCCRSRTSTRFAALAADRMPRRPVRRPRGGGRPVRDPRDRRPGRRSTTSRPPARTCRPTTGRRCRPTRTTTSGAPPRPTSRTTCRPPARRRSRPRVA